MSASSYIFTNDPNIDFAVSQRTAHKEAAFVLPYLQQGSRILDVGCGPGTMTCDFATLVPSGFVTGVDVSPTVVDSATQRGKEKELNNVEFRVGNIMEGLTDFANEQFDIVFCHQLLTHVSDPVAAMREMRRLVKSKEGVIAIRESLTVLWHPTNAILEGFTRWLPKAFRAGSAADERVGENLPHIWARRAGFDEECIKNGISGLATSTRREREIGFDKLQGMIAERSSFRENMVKAGATKKDFDDVSNALGEWKDNEDGWNAWLSTEMIYTGVPSIIL